MANEQISSSLEKFSFSPKKRSNLNSSYKGSNGNMISDVSAQEINLKDMKVMAGKIMGSSKKTCSNKLQGEMETGSRRSVHEFNNDVDDPSRFSPNHMGIGDIETGSMYNNTRNVEELGCFQKKSLPAGKLEQEFKFTRVIPLADEPPKKRVKLIKGKQAKIYFQKIVSVKISRSLQYVGPVDITSKKFEGYGKILTKKGEIIYEGKLLFV